jgi:hypothetical protein
MEAAIIQNSHLIDGGSLPQSFLDLLAHIEVYKIVLKQWAQRNYADHTSYINFPEQFADDVHKTFLKLKTRQLELMGE